MYTINFCIFRIFDRHISNVINKKTFAWLFIYLNIIWIEIFYTNNIIEKEARVAFYAYIFDFTAQFLLICYLWLEMIISVFVLFYISWDTSKC